MISLSSIRAESFSEADIDFLARLDKIGFEKVRAAEYLQKIADGKIDAWRISGDSSGILLIVPTVPGAWIEGLAGNGLMKAAMEIKDCLLRLYGAPVRGATHRPGLRRLYERMGASPVATIMEIA